ncbi:MAG: hypothetical protein ABI566_05315 [Pseudolysinimonas sp.]
MTTPVEPTRRTRVLVTIAVFALLAVGLFFGVRALIDVAASQTAAPTPDPTPTSSSAGFVYVSDDYGYSIEFPAEPTEQSQTVPAGGAEIEVTSATWDNGKASLVSTGARYPARELTDTTASLQSAVDGLIANTPNAQLVSSDPATLAGISAVKAVISVPAGNLIVVIAIDGDVQYQLVAANLDPTTADGFFATFALA